MKHLRSFKTLLTILFFLCFGSMMVGSLSAQKAVANVDKAAVLRGSKHDAGAYYAKRFIYPMRAIIEAHEGQAEVSLVINSLGVVESVDIVKGISPEIDEALRQLVMSTGKWKPALLNGNAVSSIQNISIGIKLTDSQRSFSESLKAYRGVERFPLFVLDGKLVNDYVELEPYNVKSIRVIKGEKAKAHYGNSGINGVVEIQTKRGTPPVR